MSAREYECKEHGVFEIMVDITVDPVERTSPCPECGEESLHFISLPAYVTVEGGTGAGKGRR